MDPSLRSCTTDQNRNLVINLGGDMEQRFVDKMTGGLEELGIVLSERQIGQFYQYYELLIEWNKVMNLTAITELDDVVVKHFLDSLSFVKAVPDRAKLEATMIDVGTGAGFPGIPLKIAFPGLQVTLLDSLNKRVKFLDEVIHQLGLEGISTVHGRAEDFGRDGAYREQYDYAVSRAVANIATLSEYCMPFVKVGGVFVSYKSGKIDEELESGKKAVHLLGGKVSEVVKFQLGGTEVERAFVVIEKREATAKRYPRKAGMPTKEPLR